MDTSRGLAVCSGGGGRVGFRDVRFSRSSNLVSTWCAVKQELSRLDQTCKTGNLLCPISVQQSVGQAVRISHKKGPLRG